MAEASATPVPLPDDLRRVRNRKVAFTLALIVFAFDQLTKWVVADPLQLQFRREIELLSFFDLRWVENRGVSLGLLSADGHLARWLLLALCGAVAVFGPDRATRA